MNWDEKLYFLRISKNVYIGDFPGASLVPQIVEHLPTVQETQVWSLSWPWRRAWQPIPVFLPGEINGQRDVVGYSPWDHKEQGMSVTLVLQWLSLWASNARRAGLIPGQGTKILHAAWCNQQRKIYMNFIIFIENRNL